MGHSWGDYTEDLTWNPSQYVGFYFYGRGQQRQHNENVLRVDTRHFYVDKYNPK